VDKTCWGIWTLANDNAGSPFNGVSNGKPGACILEIGNLVGSPCP
jgi:hypothetical protein